MAKAKEKRKDRTSVKKLNRQMIAGRLEEAFADLKEAAGTKKFEQGMRKAGKLINGSFSKKLIEKLRKVKEDGQDFSKETAPDSHTSINDLP